MIHRTYIVKLSSEDIRGFLGLDIVVAVPGTRLLPVADPGSYGAGNVTAPPAGWVAANGPDAAYYEIRGRALRLEQVAGQAGFTPRLNLGFHLSVTALNDAAGNAGQFGGVNQVPYVTLSESLAPPPGANAAIWGAYVNPLPDPAYGPVIRLWNAISLHSEASPIYLVDFRIAENKDEDFNTLGHA